MLAVGGAHGCDLLGPRAVVVHVAHEGRAEHLAGALPAVGATVQHVARHRLSGAHAGAANTHLREAVHGAEDRDRPAHAGLNQAHRHADQRFGRGAAAEHVHVEVEADAEIAGDERREGRVAGLIGQHAVDVGGLEACVADGVVHRLRGERARCPARATRIGGLADADGRVLVAQIFRAGGVDIARQRHRDPPLFRLAGCATLKVVRRPSSCHSVNVCCLRAAAGRKLADKAEKKHAREHKP